MSSSNKLVTLKEHLNTGAPDPRPTNTNQRILDEDAYVDTLQHIITRDFYPDLYTLTKQNQHIDQYGTPGQPVTPTPIKQYKKYKNKEQDVNNNSNDNNNKSVINSNSFEEPTPNNNNNHNNKSPQEDDINDINESEEEDEDEDEDLIHYVNGEMLSNEEKSSMKNLNLKQFQNIYTSEDNYSFSEIMYKNQLEHFAKYPWIYEQQKIADDRKKYLSMINNPQKSLTYKNEEMKAITFDNDDNKTKTEIINEQNEEKRKSEEELNKKLNLYKGELEFWKFKAVNKLMFFPEADRAMNLKLIQKIQNEYGAPKCVYDNTRLPKTFNLANNKNITKISEKEKNLKGYSMVSTPQIKPGDNNDNDDDDDNINIITWGELGGTPIALDENDHPKGPLFHIPNIPKRDKIVNALNKKNSDKLRKKQEERLRNSVPHSSLIYTPYSTKTIKTPNGNKISTPLVGVGLADLPKNNQHKNKNKNHRKKRKKHRNHYSHYSNIRSIDNLSPAARKLMERNMKDSRCNELLSTPLSSVLREQYSSTPILSMNRKRKRNNKYNKETPDFFMDSNKRKKLKYSEFKKPTRSIKENNKNKKKKNKHNDNYCSSSITDGLL